MPDPKVFVAELDTRSRALQKRLEKELARAAPTNAAEGTALVGGWAKIGGEIESVLSAVYAFICASERRDPEAEYRIAFQRMDLKKAGAGQLITAIALLAHLLAAKPRRKWLPPRRTSAAIPSKLKQLVEVRNKVVHDGDTLSYEVTRSTSPARSRSCARTAKKPASSPRKPDDARQNAGNCLDLLHPRRSHVRRRNVRAEVRDKSSGDAC